MPTAAFLPPTPAVLQQRPPSLPKNKFRKGPYRTPTRRRPPALTLTAPPRIQSDYWHYKDVGRVHYRHAGTTGPTILFIPGFGCGTFHFEKNLIDLAVQGFRVYSIDKLGLGQSVVENSEEDVTILTWRDQIIAFIETVLQARQPFLVGNSLGGLIAILACAHRPDLCRGTILLNSAPFWLSIPSYIIGFWWSRLTKPTTIREVLQLVYFDKSLITDELIANILTPTKRPFARQVFTSILSSTPPDFDAAVNLAFLNAQIPVALINGSRDPWVGPIWAMRFKSKVPDTTVYEIDNAGHCPHDECPQTVDFIIADWVRAIVSNSTPPVFGSVKAPLALGNTSVVTKNAPNSVLQRLAGNTNVFTAFLLATLESIL